MDGTVEEKRTPFLHARRRARRKRRVSALSQKIKEIELEREGREGGEGRDRTANKVKQGKKQGRRGWLGSRDRGRVLGHKLPGDESHQQHPRNEGKIAWLWTTEGMASKSWCVVRNL